MGHRPFCWLALDTVRAALGELAAADLVAHGPDGDVVGRSRGPEPAPRPGSGQTGAVREGAVDALGIPAMLRAVGTVTSTHRTNENTNGLIRQYLPHVTNLQDVTLEELDEIAHLLNSCPQNPRIHDILTQAQRGVAVTP